MVHIPEFRDKWAFYRSQAHRISPHFLESEKVTQDSVAQRIPRNPNASVPATDDDGITGAAIGEWLRTDTLPDERRPQWQGLTHIPVEIWTLDRAGFERAIQRAAGDVLGWQGLVQSHALTGKLRVRPEDPGMAQRFVPEGVDPFGDPPDIQRVWPGCIARVFVPVLAPPQPEGEDRRAWMLADYGASGLYMLDPMSSPGSAGRSSRITPGVWREDQKGRGHMVLPRGVPGYVRLPSETLMGTLFDVVVLVLNLSAQPDEVRTPFDAFERRWLVSKPKVITPPYWQALRAALDDVASLIDAHEVRHTLYRQACEVVDRATALGAGHG